MGLNSPLKSVVHGAIYEHQYLLKAIIDFRLHMRLGNLACPWLGQLKKQKLSPRTHLLVKDIKMVMSWNEAGEVREPTATKQQAGYVSPSPATAQCGNCIMFKSGSCDRVIGIVETGAVCNYWEPEAEV